MTRTALVTGGTRGIGKAISAALVRSGFTVAANFSGNEYAAKQCCERLGVTCFKFDVGSFEECADGIEQIEARLGPIDIFINNAGITRDKPFHKMSRDHWQQVINVDLDSAFNVTRNVWEGMRDRGFGRVINVSSINGQKGQFGQVNYSAAKAGLIGFTKALALEGARKGITVNCIAPGYINTEMVAAVPYSVRESIISSIPVGRLGETEEIAAMAAFMSSDAASFMTGAVIPVNGGQYISG